MSFDGKHSIYGDRSLIEIFTSYKMENFPARKLFFAREENLS